MAAIDLERGLEHSGRGWGQERTELMDNFDSEMQEWEEQLQDIQRKIEELYNEVQARRGVNDTTSQNQKTGIDGCHGKGLFATDHLSKSRPGAMTNGLSHQNGYGVSEIEDLLQDYLGQGKGTSRKNNGARHVHFNDKVKVSHDIPAYQEETRRTSGNDRAGQEQLLGSFEESENRKNRVSHTKSCPLKESCPNKENAGAKPPVGQRDVAVVQARSHFPAAESPAPDRKSYIPGAVGEKKCSSPYVLRKFGAMLQENEGKTLTDSGVVTPQGPMSEVKCSTPGCQRKAVGAKVAGSRSCMLTAQMGPGQEWGMLTDSVRQNHKDQRGGYSCSKGAQPSPQQPRGRSQVAGSPKMTPKSNCEEDRDGGRKTTHERVEPKMDYRVSSALSGAQRVQRGGLASQGLPACGQVTDEGLIELLDMLDIQHEYSFIPRAGPTAYRQEPQQVNPAEVSPEKPKRSFSRPARPANQRPPSRWASRPPTARIIAPPSPMYRSPSPMTRNPSPSLKHRSPISYSLQTETVIM